MTSPPEWFNRAIAAIPADHFVEMPGYPIHYLTWGKAGDEPVLLVHGNGAHARWWSLVAPFLATRGRLVAAIDLSGMGDSGDPATDVTPERFADEIATVARQIGRGRPVDLVAHSFGGLPSVATVLRHPQLVRRLVTIDSPFHKGGEPPRSRGRISHNTVFAELDDILSRFRLLPAQDCESYVMDYIARHSVKQVAGGWTWKFGRNPWDAPAFDSHLWTRFGTAIGSLPQAFAFIRCEHSDLCRPHDEATWRSFARPGTPIVVIPAAHHHAQLDQPLALAAALDALLSTLGRSST